MAKGVPFIPLLSGGKRDAARRYVNPTTGETISRRQYRQTFELLGVKLEALARKNAEATGGRQRTVYKPSGKAVRVGPSASTGLARELRSRPEFKNKTIREIQRDPAFKQIRRDLKSTNDKKAQEAREAFFRLIGPRRSKAARGFISDILRAA